MPAIRSVGGYIPPPLSRLEPWGVGRAPPPGFSLSASAAEYDCARLTAAAADNASRLERPLTAEQALAQINVLEQTGARSEHVGILVVFGQYAAKADSLTEAMSAVWLTPDYETLTQYKRVLRDGGFFAGGVNLLSIYAFPMPSTPLVAAPPQAAPGGQLNLLA